jgi:hypothetical protein
VDNRAAVCDEEPGMETINTFTLQVFYITVKIRSSSISTVQ